VPGEILCGLALKNQCFIIWGGLMATIPYHYSSFS